MDARNLKYTAMHQYHHVVQPPNAQEKLSIQPSKYRCKTESDGSLAPPPKLLFKGGYDSSEGAGNKNEVKHHYFQSPKVARCLSGYRGELLRPCPRFEPK